LGTSCGGTSDFQSAAAEKSHGAAVKLYGAAEKLYGAAEKSHGAGQKFYGAADFQSFQCATEILQFFNFSILQFFQVRLRCRYQCYHDVKNGY